MKIGASLELHDHLVWLGLRDRPKTALAGLLLCPCVEGGVALASIFLSFDVECGARSPDRSCC